MSDDPKEGARRAILAAKRPTYVPSASPAELRRVERAFRMLSREHQDMVWMLQVENLTYAEIGVRLGIDVAEVERRTAETIGAWLEVLREDERAIFRAASLASKAADYLLGFLSGEARS